MDHFKGNSRLLAIAGAAVVAIILVIVISRLTTDHPPASSAAGDPHDRCAIARKARDAFDQGKPPPPEWIQDRAAAAEAVRNCDRP